MVAELSIAGRSQLSLLYPDLSPQLPRSFQCLMKRTYSPTNCIAAKVSNLTNSIQDAKTRALSCMVHYRHSLPGTNPHSSSYACATNPLSSRTIYIAPTMSASVKHWFAFIEHRPAGCDNTTYLGTRKGHSGYVEGAPTDPQISLRAGFKDNR